EKRWVGVIWSIQIVAWPNPAALATVSRLAHAHGNKSRNQPDRAGWSHRHAAAAVAGRPVRPIASRISNRKLWCDCVGHGPPRTQGKAVERPADAGLRGGRPKRADAYLRAAFFRQEKSGTVAAFKR